MDEYLNFLKQAEAMTEKYASIYLNCELEPLVMPFWSWAEIQDGLRLREDWEVDVSLVPFYGDWHDLFCLNQNTGEIIALNNDREEICKWDSIQNFTRCLSEQEIFYDDSLDFESLMSQDSSDADNVPKLKH